MKRFLSRTATILRSRRQDLLALLALATLAAALWRSHLLGRATHIGNSDRLDQFLSLRKFHVETIQEGSRQAWSESEFMGVNTYGMPYCSPGPVPYLQSLLPLRHLYRCAGVVSMFLLLLAGAAAYSFMRESTGRSLPALIGAALYMLSSQCILKINQNDQSFGALIHIPLVLLALRRVGRNRASTLFVVLTGLLSLLFWFVFLQKVAYAVLLFVAYAVYRGFRLRSPVPPLVLAGALVCAGLASLPRVGMVHEEMREAAAARTSRPFEEWYSGHNVLPREGLRFFNDGVFGRHPREAKEIGNQINLSEGFLLHTSVVAAFLLILGFLRLRGRWFGWRADPDLPFHFAVIAAVALLVLTKPGAYLLYRAFLRADFIHSRITLVALVPFCTLIASIVSSLSPAVVEPRGRARVLLTLGTILCGLFAGWFVGSAVPRMYRSLDSEPRTRLRFVKPRTFALRPELVRTAAGLAVLAGILVLHHRLRSRPRYQAALAGMFGLLMVSEAFVRADQRMNGRQNRDDRVAFKDHNWLVARPEEYRPPSPDTLGRLHAMLERDRYRTVLIYSEDVTPSYCSPHIMHFYRLRAVEGYNFAVPSRLAALPWPDGTLTFRSIHFRTEGHLPWPLLAILNVKYAVFVTPEFHRNTGPRGETDLEQLRVLENPFRPLRREAFAARVRPAGSLEEACAHVLRAGSAEELERFGVAEGFPAEREFSPDGEIRAAYRGDEIDIEVTPHSSERFLVLNELHHPRWRAFVDGRETRIYPTNLVMRGVLVPAGASRIRFRFEPLVRTPAAWICLGGSVLLLMIAWVAGRRLEAGGSIIASVPPDRVL